MHTAHQILDHISSKHSYDIVQCIPTFSPQSKNEQEKGKQTPSTAC